ncbi:alpha-amylase family glycosyl hydrolase [Leadbettera azotonutricia]|uniref:Alpha amylase catalytic region n=1 Tax=Leadbettera azotonutricia (strain ATCC BAA-888 / DSM 13862 / ZAS-9) TaxID=545695 RepID=F5YF45_LEAAZ|nr:alpha amylase catalytic region [Leadbettera azotonutricia ZAS-9]
MEFHIRQEVRKECGIEDSLFSLTGNVVLTDVKQVRALTVKLNSRVDGAAHPELIVKAGQLNAMGLIDEILHYMVALYREQVQSDVFDSALERINQNLGARDADGMLHTFGMLFPPKKVYTGKASVEQYLEESEDGESCRSLSLEELMLLALANLNPAFKPFFFLFGDTDLRLKTVYPGAIEELKAHFAELPVFGPEGMNLWDLLRAPALAHPDSLTAQLEFMRKRWGLLISKYMGRLLTSLDVIKEEDKPFFGGPGPTQVMEFGWMENEYEHFSPDQEWMPRTVLMAKSTLVWLYQLTRKYHREIARLDQIPDEELDELSRRGFTGLWLIGLWERSNASKTVKQWTGNPEAAASAYSLHDYDIAEELGGWGALQNLRERCYRRGVRLGSDMVPNHTGLDSRWVMENPDRFLQLKFPPYPTYTFNGGNLSNREGVGIYLEDHYYNRTDAAVVFKRVDFHSGDTRYIYHGNDGTSMPWNDTAQIDFLNPEAREAVIRTIIGVCQQFSIVRFDAAMTLAKRHIQRLWYPEPGHGGDIASRSEHALASAEFNRRIPNEFWREVVDRCATEAPHTLLLAEAFWMMEGYFVRTLGMHRVYNSAFMNMLKNEENAKYRATIKNTLEFDPEVLKRFVNFMNNPDEDTAVAQFGKGDKYFGIATLLVTMPGLPMFGHGQIEGFEEKYGMEYRRSYRDEKPDQYLIDRHEREIFPLMKKRHVFSGSADFCLYDLVNPEGSINENVFAYSNRAGGDMALVFYNNAYGRASGWIRRGAVSIPQKDGTSRQDSLCEALSLHGEDRFFTIFREQRAGLWYVRSSKEIAERGLFVGLNGYEAQAFLDIHEAEDVPGAEAGSWNGRWARLNFELNGRGVKDLEAALLDIYLGELYAPFNLFFKPERMEQLSRFFTPGSSAAETEEEARNAQAKKAEFVDYFKQPVLAFADTAAKYLAGIKGGYEAFKTENEYAPPEQSWAGFSAYLERLILMAETEEGKDIAARPQVAVLVLGYGVLTLLRSILGKGSNGEEAARLADHWQLVRKLRECWEKLGVSADEARRIAALARMVLARTSPADPSLYAGALKADELAAALVLENYDADDFRQALAVNRFEDITWFNKEAFEETISRSSLFLIPEAAIAFGDSGEDTSEKWKKRAGVISAAARSLLKAEKASGYRLEELPGVLSGAGTKQGKAAPKPAKTAGKGAKKAEPKKTKPKKR